MAFLVSPGVSVKETDLTNVVPAVATSIGAIAGRFNWGPVSEIVTIGSEKELVEWFGAPTDDTYKYFMPAAQFLQYSNTLKVVRAATDNLFNAHSGETIDDPIFIGNRNEFETTEISSVRIDVVAKYPGALGNSIGIAIFSNLTSFESLDANELGFNQYFDSAPDTTEYALERGVLNDEVHVLIYDSTGELTGNINTPLEVFPGLSQASDAKRSDGTTNYFVDYVNAVSKYVWIKTSSPFPEEFPEVGIPTTDLVAESGGFKQYTTFDNVIVLPLDFGSNGASPTAGNLQLAYDQFADADTVDVNFIIGTEVDASDDVSFGNYLLNLATQRKDAVAFVSPAINKTVNNISATSDVKAWADQLSSTSYGVLDSTALYVYDKYNDKYRWIIAAGSVAGLCAYTDDVSDPWFSPAGFSRGQIRGVTKLALNPTQNQRDTLYKARVNPIVSFPGQGIVLFGDKTAQAKPSAFDRINVRRLFITLEKAVSTAAKFQLFELNDEFTRAQFRNLVEPFLRDVQGRRGVTDFRVVCDETNNTPEVIDTNRFVADIYIKPARSINFISLNFIATRTGVEFSEIVGQ